MRTVVLVEVARGGRDGVGGGLQLHGARAKAAERRTQEEAQRAAGAEGLSAKWLGALAGVSGGGSKWKGVDESGIITRHGHGDRTAGRVLTFGRRSY